MKFLKLSLFIISSVLLFSFSSVIAIQAHSGERASVRGRAVVQASTGCAPFVYKEYHSPVRVCVD